MIASHCFKNLTLVMLAMLCLHCEGSMGEAESSTKSQTLEDEGDEEGDRDARGSSDAVKGDKKKKQKAKKPSEAKPQPPSPTLGAPAASVPPSAAPASPAPAPAPAPAPEPEPTPTSACIDGDDFTCKAEEALFGYTNAIRAREGQPPLEHDYQLDFVARDWSTKQGAAISHDGFPTARASVFQTRFPSDPLPRISGENVAMFTGPGTDPDAVAKFFAEQWDKSPGHHANIVGGHRAIGLGIKCTSSGNAGGLFGGGGVCTGTQIFSQ